MCPEFTYLPSALFPFKKKKALLDTGSDVYFGGREVIYSSDPDVREPLTPIPGAWVGKGGIGRRHTVVVA